MNFSKLRLKFKISQKKKKQIIKASRTIFWFLTGAILTFVFVSCFGFFAYEKYFSNKVFLGVSVGNADFGGKTKDEVRQYFYQQNLRVSNTTFTLTSDYGVATVSAKEINFGYDINLLSDQAYLIGRSGNFLTDLSTLLQSYFTGVKLSPSYTVDKNKLTKDLKPLSNQINKKAVNAVFKFENNRVTTFTPSNNGEQLNFDKLTNEIYLLAPKLFSTQKPQKIYIKIPVTILYPNITTEKANSLGIKELIGEGHSLFYHSIASRIHNIVLAASRLNGVLVAPGEVFSFDKALGDVSSFTGYQQAYIIQNGKTILGDGGGVCQVSTTFFRAILNSGLPVVERYAHAYRVGYYEEDSPPGIDATIYVPTVDLKFKNDTGRYILVQSAVDLNNLSLAFYFYGTKDGRIVTMTTPVVSNQRPPPPPLYQDDPTLPKGEVKQTDFAAWGADVYFTRTVEKNGKIIISDKFVSNYKPWQAIYLVGTQ